jgi:hypothetical protein
MVVASVCVCAEDAIILINWLIDELNIQRVLFLTEEEQNKQDFSKCQNGRNTSVEK